MNIQREIFLQNLRRDERTSNFDSTVLETVQSLLEGNSHVKVGSRHCEVKRGKAAVTAQYDDGDLLYILVGLNQKGA